MKKETTIEASFCDECKKQTYPYQCLGCKIDHCWECKPKCGVEYGHSLHFGGSGDGYFCHSCNTNPPPNVTPLWRAYRAIRALRDESTAYCNDLEKRAAQAEAHLKSLLGKS